MNARAPRARRTAGCDARRDATQGKLLLRLERAAGAAQAAAGESAEPGASLDCCCWSFLGAT
jgi:hypothetical protein